MIFVAHYILFTAGSAAIQSLLTLFLRTHTDATMSEIGVFLMTLPFVSIFIKPLFCTLADRWHAHRQILICSLIVMSVGAGSCAIWPFFISTPSSNVNLSITHISNNNNNNTSYDDNNFYTQPPFSLSKRLVWYLDIVGILIGFSAFSVAWSLGDSLSVNAAIKNKIPWAYYRVWATISWGVFGELIGQFNETPLLPKYTPAFFVMVIAVFIEVVLLLAWRDRQVFEMSEQNTSILMSLSKLNSTLGADNDEVDDDANTGSEGNNAIEMSRVVTNSSPARTSNVAAGDNSSLQRTPPPPPPILATGSADVRLFGAVASSIAEDLSTSLRSRFRFSLHRQNAVDNSMLFVNASQSQQAQTQTQTEQPSSPSPLQQAEQVACTAEQLQVEMLKLIVISDGTVIKYFTLFSLFGFLMFCHSSFIMLHLASLCAARKYNFSRLAGAVFATHATSETLAFLVIVPFLLDKVGKLATLLLVFALYAGRYTYYSRPSLASPTSISLYYLLFAEIAHGLAYAIIYTLITKIGLECVGKVDEVLPTLLRQKQAMFALNESEIDARALRLVLRASMQSLFSAAFDGLGAASAALVAGLFLNSQKGRSFADLWRLCTFVSIVGACAFILTEALAICIKLIAKHRDQKKSLKEQQEQVKQELSLVSVGTIEH